MSSLVGISTRSVTQDLSEIREAIARKATATGLDDLIRISECFEAQVNSVFSDDNRVPLGPLDGLPFWPIDVYDARYLPKRHHKMFLLAAQLRYWASVTRFNMLTCGRRTGKTELVKRKRVKTACSYPPETRGKIIFGAPTHGQANRIYWRDLVSMVPPQLLRGPVELSKSLIPLWNGVDIIVTGMDVPERVEGDPLLGIVLDEFGNMKPHVWDAHVRPALADTQGWGDVLGVPEGRNHYYDMKIDVEGDPEWTVHHWTTEQVLPLYLGDEAAEREMESAKRRMDPLTYDQEFNASFVTFEGQCYYAFGDANKVGDLPYDPDGVLILCFDFNVSPGVCVIVQEGIRGTYVIGEVHIPRNSNTPAVVRKVIEEWGDHAGIIQCYGDATGGAKGTAKVDGSDWDIIRQMLREHWGDRVRFKVGKSNPRERVRVNAMNSRICTISGEVNLYVSTVKAKNVIKDLEGVRLLKGGAGEIDKKVDPKLTHLSDALGYYVADRWPVKSKKAARMEQY